MSDEKYNPKLDFSPLLLGIFSIICSLAVVAALHCAATCWYRRRQVRQPSLAQVAQPNQEISTSSTGSCNSTQLLNVYVHSDECKEGTCPVCLSDFMEGEEVKILQDCAHMFHVACIDMWLNSHPNCPLCRTCIMPLVTHVVVSLPSSRELSVIVEPLPSSAGLPSPVHN